MSEAGDTQHHVPLTVLPHSGKVDQMRSEMLQIHSPAPMTAVAATHADSDEPYIPHQNRISASPAALKSAETLELEKQVVAAMKTVFDPEIPVDIYQLGLIYDIDIDSEKNVQIRMTLTAPGCPVAGSLPIQVEQVVEAVPDVKSSSVELVWDPPWEKEMMSEAAKLQLGFL